MPAKRLSFFTRNRKGRIRNKILAVIFISGFFLFWGGINPPIPPASVVSAQTVHPCLARVNIPMNQMHWLYVPESADPLYTEEELFFLGGQLITNRVVDASICPSGGLMQNGYANACGMATALPKVVFIQNLLNEPILQAWKDVGVPPVMLKQLILFESQFWPAMFNDMVPAHYGFGMITSIGLQNAVEWNPDLYAKVCLASASGNCLGYQISSQALSSLINVCETCEYGIDTVAAIKSVDILAEALMGYCYQTAALVTNATGWNASLAMDYATLWKLTLMNYNAGPSCVYDSVISAFKRTEGPMNWADISARVTSDQCVRGLTYSNQITAKYSYFNY